MAKRILHTMLRVGDLDRSINFYTNVLGMKLLRKSENEEFEYTLAFIGYAEESESAVIELTYNWGTSEYDLGNGYGHIAISTDDIYCFLAVFGPYDFCFGLLEDGFQVIEVDLFIFRDKYHPVFPFVIIVIGLYQYPFGAAIFHDAFFSKALTLTN